jgi:hypothetical protein
MAPLITGSPVLLALKHVISPMVISSHRAYNGLRSVMQMLRWLTHKMTLFWALQLLGWGACGVAMALATMAWLTHQNLKSDLCPGFK